MLYQLSYFRKNAPYQRMLPPLSTTQRQPFDRTPFTDKATTGHLTKTERT